MSSDIDASCRVAFAALIHDIGKFLQRTKVKSASDENKQLYCPETQYGWTHIHSAYTAEAIDELEKMFPTILGDDVYPFKAMKERNVDDSLLNAAACHHKPQTFLQKVITVADRLSSAFEREEYEKYTKQQDSDNYITSRLTSFFEQLDKESVSQTDTKHTYPLYPLSASSCFSQLKTTLSETEAAKEYEKLWGMFKDGLKQIPEESKRNWPQWLDHFDTLWLTYTHSIPSATAFVSNKATYGTISNVSLYDHSKSTAALATALWRYYVQSNLTEEELFKHVDTDEDEPFLLIQGDISGIQDFIFSQGSETQDHAAKILRGRSFFISLFSECAALKILETLGLPSTSQIINAAGHFMIVAPNTKDVIEKLQEIKKEIETWFYNELYAVSNIAIAWKSAGKKDFTSRNFEILQKELHLSLEKAKMSQFDLCKNTYSPVFYDFVEHCSEVCEYDGRFPVDGNKKTCSLCSDIKNIGDGLAKNNYIIISKKVENGLNTKIFGYKIQLSNTLPRLELDKCSRVWDISLPKDEKQILFNGYARRNINAFIPKDEEGRVLDFEKISQKSEGKNAIMTLKGDIDNLGFMFQERIKHKTFASYAGISRLINTFFTVVVPSLCIKKHNDIYTIFAGGDDFFFVAPWDKQIEFLKDIKEKFDDYVCNNLTFSVGMVMSDAKTPVRILADLTEAQLEDGKTLPDKDGVCCFNISVKFDKFLQLYQKACELDINKEKYKLSTGFIYRLISLCEKAKRAQTHPQDAIWRSWLAYRITRHVNDMLKDKTDDEIAIKEKITSLSQFLGSSIEKYTDEYKIALFIHLYKLRKEEENKNE